METQNDLSCRLTRQLTLASTLALCPAPASSSAGAENDQALLHLGRELAARYALFCVRQEQFRSRSAGLEAVLKASLRDLVQQILDMRPTSAAGLRVTARAAAFAIDECWRDLDQVGAGSGSDLVKSVDPRGGSRPSNLDANE
jgi:hypothetical protein